MNSESFNERSLSTANDVVTDGNTMLSSDEIEMACILRMNREFMKFMRSSHGDVADQEFGITLVEEPATTSDIRKMIPTFKNTTKAKQP